jgi:hypothetical protein
MNKLELSEYVVDTLGRGVPRNDILLEVCKRSGMNWQEAERFVTVIEVKDSKKLEKHRSPLMFMIGLAMVIEGSVQVLYAIYPYLPALSNLITHHGPLTSVKLEDAFSLLFLVAGNGFILWTGAVIAGVGIACLITTIRNMV